MLVVWVYVVLFEECDGLGRKFLLVLVLVFIKYVVDV